MTYQCPIPQLLIRSTITVLQRNESLNKQGPIIFHSYKIVDLIADRYWSQSICRVGSDNIMWCWRRCDRGGRWHCCRCWRRCWYGCRSWCRRRHTDRYWYRRRRNTPSFSDTSTWNSGDRTAASLMRVAYNKMEAANLFEEVPLPVLLALELEESTLLHSPWDQSLECARADGPCWTRSTRAYACAWAS